MSPAWVLSLLFFLLVFPVFCFAKGDSVKTLRLQPVAGMERAELKYFEVPENCAGVLVLCPGWNGDGAHWIRDAAWREFARKRNFALVGLSFASPDTKEAAETGYHHAEKGSGELLFAGLEKVAGKRKPVAGGAKKGGNGGGVNAANGGRGFTVVLFGFSRGGQFAMSVAEHFPERVAVWGATGAGPVPLAKTESHKPPDTAQTSGAKTSSGKIESSGDAAAAPPGVVVCGLEEGNFGAALSNFLMRLRQKRRVCWLGIPATGHTIHPRAETWTRDFFAAVLERPAAAPGIWIEGEFERGLDGFLLQMWFPDEKTRKAWEAF